MMKKLYAVLFLVSNFGMICAMETLTLASNKSGISKEQQKFEKILCLKEKQFIKTYIKPKELIKAMKKGHTSLIKELLDRQNQFWEKNFRTDDYITLLKAAYKEYPNAARRSQKNVEDLALVQKTENEDLLNISMRNFVLKAGGAFVIGSMIANLCFRDNELPESTSLAIKMVGTLFAGCLTWRAVDNFQNVTYREDWQANQRKTSLELTLIKE